MLGEREPHVYGIKTLTDIEKQTSTKLNNPNLHLEWFQSNIEGEIVSKIQESHKNGTEALVINPGGYAHTSVAIHDALKILQIPVIEVHLSQVYQREAFRHNLLTAKACTAIMSGLGIDTYYLAICAILNIKGN